MIPMLFQITASTILASILLILAILVVVFIIFALGRLIAGLLVNTILGLLSIYVLNVLFGLNIPFSLPIIIVTAILGLPAVLVIVILRLGGIIQLIPFSLFMHLFLHG